MRIGILSGGCGWHVQDLERAITQQSHEATVIDFRTLSHGLFSSKSSTLDAVIVRTMPAGSLEQIVFRMDLLQEFALAGITIVNAPRAIETCVDKHLTDLRLRHAGLPVPRTVVTQSSTDAMIGFADLGRDVVIKPLFGSEGRGMIRITDPELAWRTFRAIEHTCSVIYLQEYVHHPGWDLRVFVLGERIVGSMKRSAKSDWRTNVAQGAHAESVLIDDRTRSLALHAARVVGCEVAGVDLLPGPHGEWYVLEVNAVPGWRTLQDVCQVDVASSLVEHVAAVRARQ